jgi:hypothetical protein
MGSFGNRLQVGRLARGPAAKMGSFCKAIVSALSVEHQDHRFRKTALNGRPAHLESVVGLLKCQYSNLCSIISDATT